MASPRFWYVPLKQLAVEQESFEPVLSADVVDESMLAEWAPQKLHSRGVGQGDLLALMEGTETRGVARVISIAPHTVKWRSLPISQGPDLTSAPNLAEVPANEAAEFRFAVDTLLRDVAPALSATSAVQLKTYTPIGPASNVILYGPPGTGKTHSVRRRALELLGLRSLGARPLADASVEQVQVEWEVHRREGQIVFCTFHQAFAYEEFVEGLRASTDENGSVHYRVEPGTFKRLALTAAAEGLAEADKIVDLDFDTRWSLLVTALQTEPRVVKSRSNRDYILETTARDNIRAFSGRTDQDGVFSKDKEALPLIASRESLRLTWSKRASLGPDPSTTTLGEQIGGGATVVWMVYRELQNAAVQPAEPIEAYELARRALAAGQTFTFSSSCRQFVLVIDEINRANIARVFGELITLLEPDKRLGNKYTELCVQLPASKEWFGVPPNLHVLGTMNTADRSIALMDVALRRRFTFEEMMPDASTLKEELAKAEVEETLRTLVVDVFTKLNERLRYLYDREHQIGHAFFLNVRSLADLRTIFADRILPLLQEYFFGQWEKVALTLGYPMKADGAPKEMRSAQHGNGTFLTVQKLEDKSVLGFDHDEYVAQFAWDVHPAFRPRGNKDDVWLKQAFDELVGAKAV